MINYLKVKDFLRKSLAKVEKEILVHDKKKGTYYRKQLVNAEEQTSSKNSSNRNEDDWDNFDADAYLTPEQIKFVKNLKTEYSPWIKSLTNRERDTLNDYTEVTYDFVNKHLRGVTKPPLKGESLEEANETIDYLTSALNKSEVKTPLTVHRQIKGTTLIDQFKECMKSDSIWEDPAFMSTTVVENSFNVPSKKGILYLTIDVPKGKGIGGFVRELSEYPEEQEFLLNRGSQFKVTKITEKSSNEYVINLKLIGRSSDSNE